MTKNGTIKIDDIIWDPSVYPRSKWTTATIERYAEALESGAEFPPVVLEAGTNRLLDGKHRVECYKLAGRTEIPATWHTVPEGMTPKYYAATLSAAHGDRLSNADLKALAEEEFRARPSMSAAEWGRRLGVPERTVRRWVSHIVEPVKRRREVQAWHLAKLGWTQEQIGKKLGVADNTICVLLKNGQMADFEKTLGPDWNAERLEQEAKRLEIPLVDAWAAALDGMDDEERLRRLGIKIQPYDVWTFHNCHELMGSPYPGRIPGQLVCHALWLCSRAGDLVVDPMAGSGTTLDACLLMGRRCRGYDIDQREERIDIEKHDMNNGWPVTIRKADLVFWDPPYFKKKDGGKAGRGGQEGYIEGSISRLSREEYLAWFERAFASLMEQTKKGTMLCFVMSDWDPEGDKKAGEKDGVFLWDYAELLRGTGWRILRRFQCPLSTEQVQPWSVAELRETRRWARLGRDMLVAIHD